MGDCDGICKTYEFSYDDPVFHYPHCREEWIGDGHCDCLCKTEECQFDGGDCKHIDCTVILNDLRLALLEVIKAEDFQTTPDESIKTRPGDGASGVDDAAIQEQRSMQKPRSTAESNDRRLGSENSVGAEIGKLQAAERRRLMESLLPPQKASMAFHNSEIHQRRRRRKLHANSALFTRVSGEGVVRQSCLGAVEGCSEL